MSFGGILPMIPWLCVLAAVPAAAAPTHLRVAILDDNLPGLDRAMVDKLASEMTAWGETVTRVTAAQLAAPAAFGRQTQDVLVLSDSPVFPGKAAPNVERFLQAGGDLVLMGGKAYARPVCKARGKWCDRAEFEKLQAEEPVRTPLFSFDDGDLTAWRRSTNKPEHPSRAVAGQGEKGKCLRLELKDLGAWQWDTYSAPMPVAIPASDDLLLLDARGPTGTPEVLVEIDEADGARWMATLHLGREWRRYAIEAASFRFFKDGSPAGRGGPGDRLHLDRARRISFGLVTTDKRRIRGDQVIEIDEVGAGVDDLGTSVADFAPPNTVCFDDYEPYVLRDATRVAVRPGQKVATQAEPFSGRIEGLSAVGFRLWDRSELIPLLQAEDRYGRVRGWAASTLVNYGGRYKGGVWLLSGVTTPAFYGSRTFSTCLKDFLAAVRSPDLVKECAARNAARLKVAIPLTTPAPGALRISDDGRHFLLPDGRRAFLMGCDYIGSLDRKFFGGPWLYWLDADFRRAHEAGLNCMRIYGARALYTYPEKLAALKECARKYDIYLLIVVVDHTSFLTREALEAQDRKCAEAFKDEPMVLGYDLQNEPYAYKLAAIRDGAQTLGEKYPDWKRWGEYEKWAGLDMAGNFTSFPGARGPLPTGGPLAKVLHDTNGIFGDWIRWQVEAIRSIDKTHPITVGYNSDFALLPANAQLDFVSHHAYQAPVDYAGVMKNLTTMDRLHEAWPDKPISLGEFGYTNGAKVGGRYLDFHTTAVGELLHWLYAYAHGYEGCIKWVLTDQPLVLSVQQNKWMPADDLAQHIDQGRYGFFWSDGTIEAQPKPLVWALRFLRKYVDAGGDRGKLEVVRAKTQIGTGYVFRAPGAVFVGNVEYRGPEMEFASKQAANVMLRWDGREARVMSTADATVRVNLKAVLPKLGKGKPVVSGKCASSRRDGDWLEIGMLEGEVVTVAAR